MAMQVHGPGVVTRTAIDDAYMANQADATGPQSHLNRSYRTGRLLPIKRKLSPEEADRILREATHIKDIQDYDVIDGEENDSMGRCTCHAAVVEWATCNTTLVRPSFCADEEPQMIRHKGWTIVNSLHGELCPVQKERANRSNGKWAHCEIAPKTVTFMYGPTFGFNADILGRGQCPMCDEEAGLEESADIPTYKVAGYHASDSKVAIDSYEDPSCQYRESVKHPLRCGEDHEPTSYFKRGLYYHKNDLFELLYKGLDIDPAVFIDDYSNETLAATMAMQSIIDDE